MSFKTWVPLVLAIVLGLIAAKFVSNTLQSRKDAHASVGQLTQIVVSKHPLTPGQSLGADDLTIGDVGKNSVPEASFASTADVIGRTVLIPMGKGQPIIEGLLSPKGNGSGLQALVPKGMRAITIEINEFSSVGGMILPGCRVDVLATLQGKNGVQTRTVVQNVKVTAVGQRVVPEGKEGGEPFKSVTLLATPEQAETIELVATLGRPRLSLRSGRDNDLTRTKGIDVAAILGETRANTAVASDPFNSGQPVQTISIPSTNPSTQPSQQPVVDTRSISVIRAGQESFVTVQITPAGSGTVVGTDGTPVDSTR